MSISRYRYILFFLLVYAVAILHLHFTFHQPYQNYFSAFFIIGIGFSVLVWLLTREIKEPIHRPAVKNEIWILVFLVLWICFYITYGGDLVNKFLPANWIDNKQVYTLIIFLRKLLFFIIFPFTVYRVVGFSWKDFGLANVPVKFFSRQSLVVFIVVAVAVLLFQYFMGHGSKLIRDGQFSTLQLIKGLPLCFIYLLFDAGFIEEFFFRGLLQSRLSVVLKSATGGIVISAIIFGLVHAPGLYLRGAGNEGNGEHLPFTFFAAYSIAYMSIAGIFLGIIYSKTKNLWLVMVIHAIVDLLPNLPGFLKTWHM
jgi:membrane protease YdiL (CAAX protease family)